VAACYVSIFVSILYQHLILTFFAHTHTHTYTHSTRKQARTHAHAHTYMHMHTHAPTQLPPHTHTHSHTHPPTHTHTHTLSLSLSLIHTHTHRWLVYRCRARGARHHTRSYTNCRPSSRPLSWLWPVDNLRKGEVREGRGDSVVWRSE